MRQVINILFNDFTNDNRVFKECKTLQKNGYDVTLVATRFDRSLPIEEELEGFKVRRFNVGRIKFLPLNLLLFWFSIIKYYRNSSVFHCNDLYALPPAYFIKKILKKRAKIVYDCHEHETEAQIYIGNPILKMSAKIIERKMIPYADKVIVVSKSIRDDYVDMYKINPPALVMNCPNFHTYKNEEYFRKVFKIPKENIILLYVGIYKQGRGLERLISLFKRATKKNKKLSLVLLTWGDGIEKLKESIKDDKNIFIHGSAPLNVFMGYVASADFGVLLLENISKNNDYALPNKLFDYVMAKLPVITSNLKEMAQFINENKVGYVVDLNDEKKIIDLMVNLDVNTKKALLPNLERARKIYTWKNQEKVLVNLYKTL